MLVVQSKLRTRHYPLGRRIYPLDKVIHSSYSWGHLGNICSHSGSWRYTLEDSLTVGLLDSGGLVILLKGNKVEEEAERMGGGRETGEGGRVTREKGWEQASC